MLVGGSHKPLNSIIEGFFSKVAFICFFTQFHQIIHNKLYSFKNVKCSFLKNVQITESFVRNNIHLYEIFMLEKSSFIGQRPRRGR